MVGAVQKILFKQIPLIRCKQPEGTGIGALGQINFTGIQNITQLAGQTNSPCIVKSDIGTSGQFIHTNNTQFFPFFPNINTLITDNLREVKHRIEKKLFFYEKNCFFPIRLCSYLQKTTGISGNLVYPRAPLLSNNLGNSHFNQYIQGLSRQCNVDFYLFP